MALLAEELVEGWMNRKGFFTIRGAKQGVNEIDLLGIRYDANGTKLDAWHVECQVSFNPAAYISKLSETDRVEFNVKAKNSAKKRPQELLQRTVAEWVEKKFRSPLKVSMREKRWPRVEWKLKLVHGRAKYPEELELIGAQGIELIPFSTVLSELGVTNEMRGGSGADVFDIVDYYVRHLSPK